MSVIYTPPARWNQQQQARRAKPDTIKAEKLEDLCYEARFVNDGITCGVGR